MTSPIHSFMFDVNFSFGQDSVFSLVDTEEIAPFPPDEGFFLYLSSPLAFFMLLDAQNLALL